LRAGRLSRPRAILRTCGDDQWGIRSVHERPPNLRRSRRSAYRRALTGPVIDFPATRRHIPRGTQGVEYCNLELLDEPLEPCFEFHVSRSTSFSKIRSFDLIFAVPGRGLVWVSAFLHLHMALHFAGGGLEAAGPERAVVCCGALGAFFKDNEDPGQQDQA
jgi:hypothetical protein